MELHDIDSSRLLFDIHSKTLEKDIKKKIPEFADYDGPIPILSLIQYIVLVYDPRSPLVKEYRDYIQRKRVCAEMVGLPKTKGRWAEATEAALLGEDKGFNAAIVGYLRELALPEWTQLVAFLQLQENHTREILAHSADRNVHAALSAITKGITDLTRKLFISGDIDEVEAMRKALYDQVKEDVKKLRPEMVAMQLKQDGKIPDEWSPYFGGAEKEKRAVENRRKTKKEPRKRFYKDDGSIDHEAQKMKYAGSYGNRKRQ